MHRSLIVAYCLILSLSVLFSKQYEARDNIAHFMFLYNILDEVDSLKTAHLMFFFLSGVETPLITKEESICVADIIEKGVQSYMEKSVVMF